MLKGNGPCLYSSYWTVLGVLKSACSVGVTVGLLEIVLESCTESREFKVLENRDLLAKRVVSDDSEKFEISRFGTTFQNDLCVASRI